MTDVRDYCEPLGYGGSPTRKRPRPVAAESRRILKSRLDGARMNGLTRTVEVDIIPRLVMAHKAALATKPLPTSEPGDPEQGAATLAEQILSEDTEAVCTRIEALRAAGHSLKSIYIKLLAPTASHLRRLWANDLCGFAEVTLALWRLQQVLRHYSVEFRSEVDRQDGGHRALLVPNSREKHDLSYIMFGLVMMSEFLRRDGWEAWIEPDTSSREFVETVRNQWFDVVEFLVSGDKQLDALASGIRMIRRDSPNRSIGVMVCGQVFIEHPELVLLVGADLTANDARQAALTAESSRAPDRNPLSTALTKQKITIVGDESRSGEVVRAGGFRLS